MARPRKHNPPLPDSQRVADYRKRLKKEGYRNISFLVSPEEYDLIEKARGEHDMTTKELFLFFLSGQYHRHLAKERVEFYDEFQEESHIIHNSLEQEQYNEEQAKRGSLFKLTVNTKNFALISFRLNKKKFPDWFPYDTHFIRDFDSHEKAIRYFLKNKSKLKKSEHVVLLRRELRHELSIPPEKDHWFYAVLTLKRIFPDIEEFNFAIDPINYYKELALIQNEFSQVEKNRSKS